MMYTFTVRNVLGARKILFDMGDFPNVLVMTTTGFEQRTVEHTVKVRDGILLEHLVASAKAWSQGAGHVQDCFPYLSAPDREFLLSGTTPKEWKKLFGDDEE